ncbi:MAG TPA: ABC transporter permease [Ilumatobacter sp.]|nr:ABC transporter permease [Ilumatobacter sp.]
MMSVLANLTARGVLGRKRALLISMAMLLPVGIATIYAFTEAGNDSPFERAELAVDIVNGLIITLLLPLVALVLGTAAIGGEIEDGTAVFLLTKPIDRRKIMIVKMAVAAACTAAMTVPSTAATAWIISGSPTRGGVVAGLAIGAFAGAALYTVVFVALSARTHRALVIGLIYVFVWEAILANLFSGLRWISIREYSIGWAHLVMDKVASSFTAHLGVGITVVGSLVVLVASFLLGSRALEQFEIGERA